MKVEGKLPRGRLMFLEIKGHCQKGRGSWEGVTEEVKGLSYKVCYPAWGDGDERPTGTGNLMNVLSGKEFTN